MSAHETLAKTTGQKQTMSFPTMCFVLLLHLAIVLWKHVHFPWHSGLPFIFKCFKHFSLKLKGFIPCQPLRWDIMSNPTSPSALPSAASKTWSCSELQIGNQRLMESKVEDSSADVTAVASYANQLRGRVEARNWYGSFLLLGDPFWLNQYVFNQTDPFMACWKVLRRQLASAKLATPPTTPSPSPTSKALSDSVPCLNATYKPQLNGHVSISTVPCTIFIWLSDKWDCLQYLQKMLIFTSVSKDSQSNSVTKTEPPSNFIPYLFCILEVSSASPISTAETQAVSCF